MKALISLRSIRTGILALALGAVGVAAALTTQPAGAQSPSDDLDDPDSYAIRVGFDPSALRIWTDRGSYRIGDSIRFCYTVPYAGQIAIYDEQPDGRVTTILAGRDDGRGDCLVGTVTPPGGRECLRIRFFFQGGGTVSRATCFDVLGGGSYTPVTPPVGGPALPASRYLRVSVEANRAATVTWQSTPAGPREWVSVVPVGTPDDQHQGRWAYTTGRTSYTTGALAPGEYVARLYRDDSANVIDRLRFRVY